MSDDETITEPSAAIKALKPGNPQFFGFDDELKFYYVGVYKFKPVVVSFNAKVKIRKQFAEHDSLVGKSQDEKLSIAQRIDFGSKIDEFQDKLVLELVPMLVLEGNGRKFNDKKWFGDASPIPAGAWWDVLRDMYNFLRGKGSRAELQLSLMPSSTK